jgi:hypothetical protein
VSTPWVETGAVIAVAAVVLLAVTSLALRRSPAPRHPMGSRSVAGILAALPTWGGVLTTALLAARGKVALATIALLATTVYVGITRIRAVLALRRE